MEAEAEGRVGTPPRDAVTTPEAKRPARTYGSGGKGRRRLGEREESPSPVKKPVRKRAADKDEDEDVEMEDEEKLPTLTKEILQKWQKALLNVCHPLNCFVVIPETSRSNVR